MNLQTSPSTIEASHASGASGAEVTVVLPTHNEQPNMLPMVERLRVALAGLKWEVIVVDDQSTDGTVAAVRDIARSDSRVRCISRVGRRGLSGACIEGALAAQAAVVVVMDADQQHDESILPALIAAVRDGNADIALGTRYNASDASDGFGGLRHKISVMGRDFAKRLLGITATDPLSGYFAIRRDVVDRLAPEISSDGFKLLLDILSTRQMKLRVAEVPYVFRSRQHGDSKFDARVALDFGSLILGRMTNNILPQRFLLFCVVGLSGVGVHLIVLLALRQFNIGFSVAQTCAGLVAIGSNFWLNNQLTYRNQELRGWHAVRGFILFYLICSFGLISNVSVANWIVRSGMLWTLGGVAGAIMSAVWNYAVSAAFVWNQGRK